MEDVTLVTLVQENVDPINVDEAFEEMMSDCYPETVKIGWAEFDTVHALKELDPVSWKIAQSEWADNEEQDELMVTFDNGYSYYWTSDVEQYVEDAEEEINELEIQPQETAEGA